LVAGICYERKPAINNRNPETSNKELATSSKMKLWQKNIESLKEVEKFTVGNDRSLICN
jgi:hypothetical protein